MQPLGVVLVTLDGGVADVLTTKGIQVVMVDFDVLNSGDLSKEDHESLTKQIQELKKMQGLPQEMREELLDCIHELEEYRTNCPEVFEDHGD